MSKSASAKSRSSPVTNGGNGLRTGKACQSCRSRKQRCERQDDSDPTCQQCLKLGLECLESAPRKRPTFAKGIRVAEARKRFGTRGDPVLQNETDFKPLVVDHLSDGLAMLSPAGTSARLAQGRDAGMLISCLLPALKYTRASTYPLLRDTKLTTVYSDCDFYLLDPIDQALFATLGALAARVSDSEFLVGSGAPSCKQVSANRSLRQKAYLCQFGAKRETQVKQLLQSAVTKVNESGLFATPDIRAIIALCVLEMLIINTPDSLALDMQAARQARPYASGAATLLRMLAAEHQVGDPQPEWYFVAGIVLLRETKLAISAGRPLNFTDEDVLQLLHLDVNLDIPIPSGDVLATAWPSSSPEPRLFVQILSVVFTWERRLVQNVSQPLAIAHARLDLDFFGLFFKSLTSCRESLETAESILRARGMHTPQPVVVLLWNIDYLMGQAFRLVHWRSSPEQLLRAYSADPSLSWHTYEKDLQGLVATAHANAFEASRRIIARLREVLDGDETVMLAFFMPGYAVEWESLALFTSLIINSDTTSTGRLGYPLSDKIADLKILREAAAICGWSNSNAQSRVHTIEQAILECQALASGLDDGNPANLDVPVTMEIYRTNSTSHESGSSISVGAGQERLPQNQQEVADWVDQMLSQYTHF